MEIRERILGFVELFREETKSLTEEDRRHFSNLDDFFEPCQIIFVNTKGQSIQHLIALHQKTRPDKEITVIDEPTWDVADALEKLLNDERWEANLPKPKKSSGIIYTRSKRYRDIVEPAFVMIIKEIQRGVFQKPFESGKGTKLLLYERDFMWQVQNFTLVDPKKLVSEILADHARHQISILSKPAEEKPVEQPHEKKALHGYGVYLYPPTYVGDYPTYTFREKVWGRWVWPKEACRCKYKGRDVIIRDNGFLAICEEDSRLVHRYLNEIMATGLLLGLPFYSVRSSEIADVSVDPISLTFTSWSIVPRGYSYWQHDERIYDYENKLDPVYSISVDNIQKLIVTASDVSSSEEVSDRLTLLVESYTCMSSSEYVNSFIVSWTIIERYLFTVWKSHLERKKVGRKRVDKLTEGTEWSVNVVIEALNIAGLLTNEIYTALTALRKKRNDVIHEGKGITSDDADECYLFASRFVKKELKEKLKAGKKIKLINLKASSW